jgi:hypothetical protein
MATAELTIQHCYLTSAELYDPSTNETSVTDEMSVERFGHRAILLQNVKVLITGGVSRPK